MAGKVNSIDFSFLTHCSGVFPPLPFLFLLSYLAHIRGNEKSGGWFKVLHEVYDGTVLCSYRVYTTKTGIQGPVLRIVS